MKLTVINSTTGQIRVHRAGCRDIDREKRRANSVWNTELPEGKTPADHVADDLCDSFGWEEGCGEDKPWEPEHITVLPCCGREHAQGGTL